MKETAGTPFVHGAAAEQLVYDVYDSNPILKEKKKHKRNNKAKVKAVMIVIVAFACCLTIIFRYAIMTEMNYSLIKLNKQYSDVRNDNAKLRIELEKKMDLQALKETAEKRLGMQKPDKYQIVHMNIAKADYTTVAGSGSVAAEEDNKIFTQLFDKVNKFTSLLF